MRGLFLFALLAANIVMAGCDKDDDGIRVNREMNEAFRTHYPEAGRVIWEHNNGYYVADFWRNGVECEAWFDGKCAWWMTETDIRYADLPQAVKAAFERSEYGSWRIDDIDMLEYPDRETVYVIEVEQGKVERDLYFTPDGVLAKVYPEQTGTGPGDPPTGDPGKGGGHNGGHQPSTVMPEIKTFIATKYPQARIVDVDTERNSIEVDIVDGRTPREVVFTLTGDWICTETEVRVADIPAVVMNAVSTSQYGSWRIDDVDHYDTPTGEYYIVELESGHSEVYLKIGTDGKIIM